MIRRLCALDFRRQLIPATNAGIPSTGYEAASWDIRDLCRRDTRERHFGLVHPRIWGFCIIRSLSTHQHQGPTRSGDPHTLIQRLGPPMTTQYSILTTYRR